MKFQKYTKYKASGVEWLGEIPEEWEVAILKNIGNVRGRVGWKALKANEYVNKSKYIFLATPNIKNKEIDFLNVNYITRKRYYESPEIILKTNDIVLTKDGSTLGTANIVSYLPSKATVNSSIAIIRLKKENSKFIFHQIKSEYIQNIVKLKKDGAGVPHLFQRDINNFKIFLPPKQTQTKIANYLDEKTNLIDKKISLLQQKKEKYKELKQTLINEVVTKGLDKTVKMKDSEIEWVGEIPEHWEIKRFKDIYYKNHTGGTPNTSKREMFSGENVWVSIADIKDKFVSESKQKLTKEGIEIANIPITPKGSLLYSFKLTLGKIAFTEIDLYTNEALISILKNKTINLNYTYYMLPLLLILNATENIYGAKMLNQKLISNALLIYPPKQEQIQIANYLDEKTGKIDEIIEKIDENIDALKEFRKTLINDAVTGKIKVA